jgi:hypothetical protein
MDIEDLANLVDRSERSAFRLETLSQYLVPQEYDEFDQWRSGRPLALPTPETSPWLARIQSSTAHGYRWYRVHVLDRPLSDYVRYELWGYRANQAAGEQIYLAERDDHPSLARLREDFWLIDDAVAVRMIYDGEGRFLRPERADDAEPYRVMRDLALRHAVPLDEYLVRRRPRLTA